MPAATIRCPDLERMIVAFSAVHVLTLALAFVNPFSAAFQAIVAAVARFIDLVNGVTHNYGWSVLLLALIVKLVLYPLSAQQYKSMKEMQAVAPYMKRLQQRYKDDKVKLQQETMALYREHGVNPLAGCLPIIAQYPILIAIYQAIAQHHEAFKTATWLWIGSPLSQKFPQIFANNLFQSDKLLLLIYALSLYFSMKITPVSDPQQAQMMKTQAIFMPVVLFYFGMQFHWMAGFVLYWFGFNVLSMAQQWYVMRRPSRIPAPEPDTPATLAGYPHKCPNCNALLVVAKGSKCEACGTKVRKLTANPNGVASKTIATSGTRRNK